MTTTGDRFAQPHEISDTDYVFGSPGKVSALMPPKSDIPKQFSMYGDDDNPFVDFQRRWFFHGYEAWPFQPKPGIDAAKAIRHLSAIQTSYAPAHEHKVAAVAYLMSLWFEEPRS